MTVDAVLVAVLEEAADLSHSRSNHVRLSLWSCSVQWCSTSSGAYSVPDTWLWRTPHQILPTSMGSGKLFHKEKWKMWLLPMWKRLKRGCWTSGRGFFFFFYLPLVCKCTTWQHWWSSEAGWARRRWMCWGQSCTKVRSCITHPSSDVREPFLFLFFF